MYKLEEYFEERGLVRLKFTNSRNDEKIIRVDTKGHPEVNNILIQDSFLCLLLWKTIFGLGEHTVDMEPKRSFLGVVVHIPSESIYYGGMQWLGGTWYVVYEELDKESGKERAHLFNAGEKVTEIEDYCFSLNRVDNCLMDTKSLTDVCVALHPLTKESDTKKYVVYSDGTIQEQ